MSATASVSGLRTIAGVDTVNGGDIDAAPSGGMSSGFKKAFSGHTKGCCARQRSGPNSTEVHAPAIARRSRGPRRRLSLCRVHVAVARSKRMNPVFDNMRSRLADGRSPRTRSRRSSSSSEQCTPTRKTSNGRSNSANSRATREL